MEFPSEKQHFGEMADDEWWCGEACRSVRVLKVSNKDYAGSVAM